MRSLLTTLVLLIACGPVAASGLLIPEEKSLPPLAMLNHKVRVEIDDQVATTKVEQTFRNHTDRQLEATYLFPVPKGAGVNGFTMWVGDKEVKGELVPAQQARAVYTSIVKRTQDPGLLEYVGNDLFQMKVFPVPAKGDQKVSLSFTAVANREANLVEYIYPLKTDVKATKTLEDFSVKVDIKSQHGVQNVYSPTHAVTLKRTNDKEVAVEFERNQGVLDKDFQLFYQLSEKDVALTALTHRPVAAEDGFFMLLVSPKVEIKKEYQVPRDMVFVLDTSGSMRGVKMDQAKKGLKLCLENLGEKDRFALINFATTVNRYKDGLLDATGDQLQQANKWVDSLEATGGTAINDALTQALDLRGKDEGRSFTVVFFTDGQPTIGETSPEKILKNTLAKNSGNTRIFTFGVGDDVNATMLDRLAEETRALSTYVRPAEDISTKTAGLLGKISNPILANLKLSATNDVSLLEVYPAQLPDLFHGSQLTVLGRFKGKGPAAVKLSGQLGKETREFVYELTFPDRTKEEKDFVEHLWARRKVGYLLDQIRANGDKKELIDEVLTLAKRYGIVTPYTSHLIVPDGVMPVSAPGRGKNLPNVRFEPNAEKPQALAPTGGSGQSESLEQFARRANSTADDLARNRRDQTLKQLDREATDPKNDKDVVRLAEEAQGKFGTYADAKKAIDERRFRDVQAGRLGVDWSCYNTNLRNQSRLDQSAQRYIQGRNCMEVGGVWIDDAFGPKTEAVTVKAQSNAYFKILEKQPQVKDVYRLGNHVVWMTPSGKALVIDGGNGKEELSDKEIEALFTAKK